MSSLGFTFPTDAAGKPGAVKPFREGKSDFVEPVANISGTAELLTNATLKATDSYSQYGQDRLGPILISKIKGAAYSDREGTLFIEQSNDNVSWSTITSLEVKGNTLSETDWVDLSQRYYRFRYANGNLQQSEFLLYQSLGAGQEDVKIRDSVSIKSDKPLPLEFTSSSVTKDGRLKVETQGIAINPADFESVQAKTADIVFHDKAETQGEGNILKVGSFKTLLIEVYGTADTSELKFWGKSLSGTKRPLRGQKVDDGTMATSTVGKSEAWTFDITGFKEIVMEITALSNGNFSVKGTAVS
ncbi:phage portal protein [Bacillus siamensis]|uniref:phage-like element PBSX protein XepA n=1 Tax=Bacillus amyloliquefaciens group TaxID=1938374 RepID=UPI0018EAB1E9|nr:MULTISPECIES: phage portal protein [Bacillus amyloliquefaciens group]MCG0590548.1 phage portal protein [Bacillus velezensis]MEC2238566.1 phage portal protein [Bacillus velezensis]MED5046435.1 phage portal protein [Bacillus siamensis]MED5096062.1 phage portal protein [Bacillus siamensis]QPV77829.1 phage portal protein [Bacillus velezensis]